MPTNRTTKEKLCSIFFVFLLFLVVGLLFAYIGKYNRQVTNDLIKKVKAERLIEQKTKQFNSLYLDSLDTENIPAKAYLTEISSDLGLDKTLAQKNADQALPIASVTKLMTAIVAIENIDLNTFVTATADYVGGDGTSLVLEIGQTYKALDLLDNMLIASDNDSAQLLASIIGEKNFIDLMNKKAAALDLKQTHYVNVTGLDPLIAGLSFNLSSANDLAKIIKYIFKNHSEILQTTKSSQLNFCDSNHMICKNILSTNQLLTDPEFSYRIIGGKTGQTVLADKNLALIIEPLDGIFLINIVLGSTDSFADTKNIINHLKIRLNYEHS